MSKVEVERSGDITVVTINRPEVRNAVDAATARDLSAAFTEFDQDPEAKIAILTGAGGHFCAGADLKALSIGEANMLSETGDGPMGPTRMRLRKPVIAAVEGYAVAGGIELAVWCDLRVMASDAIFGVFCRRFGVPLIDLGTVRLPRIVGQGHALDMILTGRPVGADEALRMGLANRVTEPGAALEGARTLAREIAVHPQTCMRNDRASVYEQWGLDFEQAMLFEFRGGLDTLSSGETAEGAARFSGGEGRHGSFA